MPIGSEPHRLALALGRHRANHPLDRAREIDLRRQIAEAKIKQFIAEVVAASPPLSAEAVAEIDALLNGRAA